MDQEYIAQTALDQMVGTDQGQLLKALIPYFPPRQQQFLSVLQSQGTFQYSRSFYKAVRSHADTGCSSPCPAS